MDKKGIWESNRNIMSSDEIYRKWDAVGMIPPNLEYSHCLMLSGLYEKVANRFMTYTFNKDSALEIFATIMNPIVCRMYMAEESFSLWGLFEEVETFLIENDELYLMFRHEKDIDIELEMIHGFMEHKNIEHE